MPLAQTTYGPAGMQTDVSGGGAGAGGVDPNMMWMMQLAQRRAQQQADAAKIAQAQQLEALKQQKMGTRAMQQARAPISQQSLRNRAAAENQAAIEQAKGAGAQARALTERGPQRYIFGLGYSGGPDQMTADVSKMTGAQRQALLPQSSGFGGPSLSEQDVTGRQTSLEDLQRQQANAAGLVGRFGTPTQYGLEQAQPGIAAYARQQQIMQQYPGMAQAMWGGR